MIPDFAEAQRFLSIIAPDGDVVFQAFDDDEVRRDTDPATSEKLARSTRNFDALAAMNAKRCGVFFTVNAVEGNRRKAENVTRVRALFADFDGVDLPQEWGIEPSVIVNTSPGKFHAYWVVDGEFPREEFADAQRAVAHHFGADAVINDLPRVMRLPGFWHRKGEDYKVRIVEASGAIYGVDELRRWVDAIKPPPEAEVERLPVRHTSLNGATPVYVKVAVEKAMASIAGATKGHRNSTLNSEAFGIFGLVKGGHVPETIRDEIERVALSIGLTKSEVRATLRSAWNSAAPRQIPQRTAMMRPAPTRPEAEHHEPPATIEEAPPKEKKKERAIRTAFGDMPFRMLGHNRGVYFYLPKAGGQIVGLKSHEHTPLRLLALAPLNAWYRARGDSEEGKITEYQWQQIANGLIHSQHAEGIFEETRLRGRGAWMDQKKSVVHTGQELIVNGDIAPLMSFPSKFVYEAAAPWEFGFGQPATNAEAHRLVEICDRLTWEDELSGALLAGWCVVAPVSGALRWRPHVWISGPAGSGKSAAQELIIGRVAGPAAIRFDGKTTEAAIRQNMGFDARPVILDEAEGEDQDAVKRMQGILDLARVSSSGGMISKGSSSHRAVNFVVRSCFCFSSIHASIRHHADESRITRLILRKNTGPDKDEHYRQLVHDIDAWFTPEYASRMFARTVKYLPVMLKNAEVFATAASAILGSRRAADQLGALLAGLYLCHSTGPVTVDAAEEFIRRHHWNDHVALDSEEDHVRLFGYMMSRQIRVLTNDGPRDMTIGQAIDAGGYERELGPLGIKVEMDGVWIANKSDRMYELLRDKPQWQTDWRRLLVLMRDATRSEGPVYFAPGLFQRAVKVPRGALRG